MLKRLYLCAAAVMISVAPPATAQPATWGDVSDAELGLDAYPADPEAAALILSDVGEVTFSERMEPRLERHVRIKILAESGYDLATVSLPYIHEDRAQRLQKVEGQTFTRTPEGGVRRTELDDDDVFREKLDGRWSRATFTLPDLAPGSVVEYRYTLRSKSPGYLPDWTFSAAEPVLYSEFVASVPRDLDYVRVMKGADFVQADEPERTYTTAGDGLRHRWVARDLPAFRDEPFMTSARDYEARLSFQLRGFVQPNFGYVPVMHTWEKVAEDLDDHPGFGRELRRRGRIRDTGEALAAGLSSDGKKLQAIYDFVSQSIATTSETGFVADEDLDDVLEKGTGDHAEAVLLFVALARAAGLDADPVLISTRSHGAVVKVYPLVTQFNSVLARVRLGRASVFVDPTDPLRRIGMLPLQARVAEGWVPDPDAPEWVEVTSPIHSEHLVSLGGRLDAEGTLQGKVESVQMGYPALAARKRLQSGSAEAFVQEEVVADVSGMELGAVTLDLADQLDAPVVTTFDYELPRYAQVVGERMYLNPAVLLREGEHPFPSRTRVSDVSYAYPLVQRLVAVFELPDGYVVEDVPDDHRFMTPGGVNSFQRTTEVEAGQVRVQVERARLLPVLEREQYAALREFYDLVLTMQDDVIVLRKTSPDAAPSAQEEPEPGMAPQDG